MARHWTRVPEGRLQELQDRAGLSNEDVASTAHMSEKTWRRYKKRGALPTNLIARFEEILGGELGSLPLDGDGPNGSAPADEPVSLPLRSLALRLGELEGAVAENVSAIEDARDLAQVERELLVDIRDRLATIETLLRSQQRAGEAT